MLNRDEAREAFEELAEKTISEAEAIKCSMEDFIAGLRAMVRELESRADQG